MRRVLSNVLLACLMVSLPVWAQEPWDPGFRVSAGSFSGARDAGLGQDAVLGLTLEGAYPLFRQGDLVVQGGYRHLPKAQTETSGWRVEDRTEGWVAGMAYRHRFVRGFFEGLYVQGGLTVTRLQTQRTTVDLLLGERFRSKGEAKGGLGPWAAVGLRFNDRWNLQIDLYRMESQNPVGTSRSATVLELGLGVHL